MSASTRKPGTPYLSAAPSLVSYSYVARRPLPMQGGTRQPGQLVPEAGDWQGRVRQCHLDLQWLEEVMLTSDDDRAAFQKQWQVEEDARQEAIKNAPKPAPPKESAPAPRPKHYLCANCGMSHDWDDAPADHVWWTCSRCHQRQTISMSRAGTLRLVSHAYNHNRVQSSYKES